MDEAKFWSMIEDAWQVVGGKTNDRQKLSLGKLSEGKSNSLLDALEEVIPELRESLGSLSQEELLAFDRILERKLYDIDRAEVQEVTDGSDDGFLYARGFIVACGKGYYDAVNATPTIAIMDLDCEEMCYLSTHVYEEKFGDMPRSEISRESCSNEKGWPRT
jgi:hypothetical protein